MVQYLELRMARAEKGDVIESMRGGRRGQQVIDSNFLKLWYQGIEEGVRSGGRGESMVE